MSAARALRDYGQSRKCQHDAVGYNSRLDELQAAIMRRAYLPKLPGWTERRRVLRRVTSKTSETRGCADGAPADRRLRVASFPVRVDPGRKDAFLQYAREGGVLCGSTTRF